MTFLRNAGLLRSAQRALLFVLSTLAGVGLTGGAASLAQGPVPEAYFKPQTLIPPDVPIEVLIGETFKFKVRFRNTGNAIGYGPFIDLAIDSRGVDANAVSPIPPSSALDCDGIDFGSARMVDVIGGPLALTSTKLPTGWDAVTNCSTPTSNSTPTHPYANVGTVTLPASGWQLATIELPFGSFDPSQPEIVVEVTAKVHRYADPNVPLRICERGGFRWTAETSGSPILEPNTTNNVGTWTCQEVTPRVFMIKKEYLGPEDETATGPNFKHKYKITLDIADGQTIGKPLTIKDCLPDGMVYEGDLVVTNVIPAWPLHTATEPPIGSVNVPPQSCLEVSWIGIVVAGGPGPDATV